MRLSDWAKAEGISLRQAQRMHSRGELPVPAYVTRTGRIMVVVPLAELRENPAQDSPSKAELRIELRTLRERLDQIERKLAGST